MSAFPDTTDCFDFRLTRLEWVDSGVAHLILDDPRSSANVMTAELQNELSQRLEQWHSPAFACRGLLVSSGKPKIYIAGADIKYIAKTADFSRDQVIDFCQRGLRLYQRFAQLPFPTLALIQGACLGGGLEFALALDWRIAADTETCVFGLPEVHLGLIPGWAATVRVPRLSSVETAMRIIGGGATFAAVEAERMGIVDQVVPAENLLAVGLAKVLAATPDTWRSRRQRLLGPAGRLRANDIDPWSAERPAGAVSIGEVQPAKCPTNDSSAVERTATAAVEIPSLTEMCPWDEAAMASLATEVLAEILQANPQLHPRAPQMVIDLLARSAGEDFLAACDLESQAMAEVYTSPIGQALVHAFLLQDRAKKSPGLGPAPDPAPQLRRVGIVGLGLMGKSISQLMVRAPWPLTLYDQDPAVRQEMARQLPPEQFTVVDSLEGLSECDAVIENVYEQLDCKRSILQGLEAVVSPHAWLFSNTSVIPISNLVAGMKHGERFCGLHFFNPIRETKLAEVATHSQTDAATTWVAAQLAKQIKKMVIVVGDGPGLVVNRLLMALLNEAQRLLAAGYSLAEIDQAAVDFGWRLGPFRIMDVIGLKTALDAGTQIAKHLPEAVTAPPFLIPLIKAGRFGQQRGLGFYRYTAEGLPVIDQEVEQLLDGYRRAPTGPTSQTRPPGATRLPDAGSRPEVTPGLAQRLVAALLVQASAILQRGQVRDAAEIDLCCLLALGFPPHQGGPLYWADHYPLGRLLEEIVDPELAAGLNAACPGQRRFYSTQPKRQVTMV